MAQNYHRLFNFSVLRRYRWRAADFLDLQDNGFVAMARGVWEGMFSGAVLKGLDLASVTGLNFTVNPGVAVGPTGNLMALSSAATGTLPSPSLSVGARHLVVLRPLLSTPASGMITPPTQPLTTAPLFVDQLAQVVVIDGASASGGLPAVGANDVILFGARLAQSASSFAVTGAFTSSTDYPGRRNALSKGCSTPDSLMWDNRCRCYDAGAPLIGIKPSQTERGLLTFNNAAAASIFPKSSGSFNGAAGDTFLNFTSGAITGSDATSSAFAPTIPTAGNFVWALVILNANDTLSVLYGTAGTYSQCRAAMKNQTLAGAGCVPSSSAFKLAFVLVGSYNGTAATELEVYDARAFSNNIVQSTTTRTVKRISVSDSPYQLLSSDQIVEVDCAGGNVSVTMTGRSASQGQTFTFDRVDSDSTKTLTLNRAGSDTFEGGGTSYALDVGLQSQDVCAGTTFWKVR